MTATLSKDAASGNQLASFVTPGGKWGASGTFGTDGGVLTWSFAGAGLSGSIFSGNSVAFASVMNFNFESIIRQAFDFWSQVANIEFIQIDDGGSAQGIGLDADLRLFAGAIDGFSGTLAQAFLPNAGGTGSQSADSGDIAFDTGEGSFWTAQSLLLVAAHEIGHTLGLDHEGINTALMNPFYNSALTGLQQDDINGIQSIYGAQDNGANIYTMHHGVANLTVRDGASNLTINGNVAGNIITGTGLGETIFGLNGADELNGGGGNDRLFGDGLTSGGASGISLGDGQVSKAAGAGNSSTATAIDISAEFSLAADADIENSVAVPHVSITGVGDGTIDYYRVAVNNPGATITPDLDYGAGDPPPASFDSFIRLIDASTGLEVASNDDNPLIDAGSSSTLDSYLTFSVLNGGIYYIAVEELFGPLISSGATYELQVSVSGELVPQGFSDTLRGGAGDDLLYGAGGNDVLFGGADNDSLIYDSGFDVLNGEAGTDLADFSAFGSAVWVNLALTSTEAWTSNTSVATGSNANTRIADLVAVENVIGTAFSDTLIGIASTTNRLTGGAGNDLIRMSSTAAAGTVDVFDGGGNTDTADFSMFGSAVWVSLGLANVEAWTSNTTVATTANATTRIADFVSIENIVGTTRTDFILGDALANT